MLNRTSIQAKLKKILSNDYMILLFVFIAIIPYTFLSVHYPDSYDLINDIARHSFFIFFVLAGLLMYKFPVLLEQIERKRHFYLRLGFILILLINTMRWNGWEPFNMWEDWIIKPQTYIYIGLVNLNAWAWVFTCLGFGKKYLNKESNLLNYCNQAVYPFYILHQTVIVILAYYVVQTPDAVPFKYFFLLFACFSICVLTYHLFIKPFNFMRFIFGMKRKSP